MCESVSPLATVYVVAPAPPLPPPPVICSVDDAPDCTLEKSGLPCSVLPEPLCTLEKSGFFSLLMLTLPSGLTLYIFTNNVLSIGQQMYLRRQLHQPGPAGGQTVEVEKKKDDRSGGGPGGTERAKLRA